LIILGEVIRLGGSKRWVPETSFANSKGWGDGHEEDLRLVVTFHRPAIAVGWVESHSDVRGHIGYKATARGLRAHKNPPALFTEAAGPAEEPDKATLQAYLEAYREAVGWFAAQTEIGIDARSSIGPNPLSMSAWDASS
jgi:hypothetical protein